MYVFSLIEKSYVCKSSEVGQVITKYQWDPIQGHRVTHVFDTELDVKLEQALLFDCADFATEIDDLPIARIECTNLVARIYLNVTDVTNAVFYITKIINTLQSINDDERMTFHFEYNEKTQQIIIT